MWTKELGSQTAMFSVATVILAIVGSFQSGVAAGLLLVPFAAVLFGLSLLARYSRVRHDVYGPKSAALFDDPRTMEISDQAIKTLTEGGLESTAPWSHFHQSVRRGGFTLLFYSRIGHMVVPDDAFRSDADREAFLTILRAQPLARSGF